MTAQNAFAQALAYSLVKPAAFSFSKELGAANVAPVIQQPDVRGPALDPALLPQAGTRQPANKGG